MCPSSNNDNHRHRTMDFVLRVRIGTIPFVCVRARVCVHPSEMSPSKEREKTIINEKIQLKGIKLVIKAI